MNKNFILLFTLILIVIQPVIAQEDFYSQAFNRGKKLYTSKKHTDALTQFQSAYRYIPTNDNKKRAELDNWVNKCLIAIKNTSELKATKTETVYSKANDFYWIEIDTVFKLISPKGKLIKVLNLEKADKFTNNYSKVTNTLSEVAYIDTSGMYKTNWYDEIYNYPNDTLKVEKNNKFFWIDKSRKRITSKFDFCKLIRDTTYSRYTGVWIEHIDTFQLCYTDSSSYILDVDLKIIFSNEEKYCDLKRKRKQYFILYNCDKTMLQIGNENGVLNKEWFEKVELLSINDDVFFKVTKKNKFNSDRYNIINNKGKLLFDEYYDDIEWDYRFFKNINMYGRRSTSLFDTLGNKLTSKLYYDISSIENRYRNKSSFWYNYRLGSYFLNSKKDLRDFIYELINSKGKVLFVFYDIKDIVGEDGYLKVKNNKDKTTLYFLENDKLVKADYEKINRQGNYLILTKNKKEYLYNLNTFKISNNSFDYITSVKDFQSHFEVKNKGKYALADSNLNIISGWYDDITLSAEKSFLCGYEVVKLNEKYGCIDKNGRLISGMFDNEIKVKCFECQRVEKGGEYAYINGEGEIITEWYDLIDDEYSRYNRVQKENKFAIIDNKGKIISDWYDEIQKADYSFEDTTLILVKKQNKFGYIDKKGTVIYPVELEDAESFSYHDYTVLVMKNEKYGVLNYKGILKVDFIYDKIEKLDGYYSRIWSDEKCGLIEIKTGNIVIPCQYQYISEHFDNILIPVKNSDKFGYINKKNKVVIEFIYDGADEFYSEFARVKKNGKYGFIDTTGNVVIDLQYQDANKSFSNDLLLVKQSGKYGYIHRNRKENIEFQFDEAQRFSKGHALVRKEKRWYYINTKGECIKGNCPENE